MRLYAEYLKLWLIEKAVPPAVALSACEQAFDEGKIDSDELRELLDVGDADRAVNANGGIG